MFNRFSRSARSVIIRALSSAQSDGRGTVGPDHILLALTELHPGLFKTLFSNSIDTSSVRSEVAQSATQIDVPSKLTRLRLSNQSKRVIQVATQEARSCWERWEAPRRRKGQFLPEDQVYWETRVRQPLRFARFPAWVVRRILRRTWEVDERHLLLGLLEDPENPGVAVLVKRGVTLEAARKRLCAITE
jgi:hypothetical protein